MNYTNHTLAAAAFCAAAAIGTTAFAETEPPEIAVGLDYCSKQVTRGLIDNEEGIVTASASIGWQGFSFEIDGIFNATDIAKEEGYDAWDNTEVDYILGYGYTFGADDYGLPTDIELALDYTYEWDNGGKYEDNDHIQYIHASIGLPEVFLSPTLAGEWELDDVHGQYYSLELSHGFDLIAGEGEDADPVLALNLSLVQGLADKKYNGDDLEKDFWAFRDTTLTATIDWVVCENLTLSPYISYSDTLAGPVRNAAKCEKHGDAGHFYGGVSISATF
ncbi:MAG: hypothetical protein IJT64_01165 [Kiritimatiellae bacterium]|nr:hypothetical protein [Kiritimatiellia bacterium]